VNGRKPAVHPRSKLLGSMTRRGYFAIAVFVVTPGIVVLVWLKPDIGFAIGTLLAGLSPTLLAIYEKETRKMRTGFAVLGLAGSALMAFTGIRMARDEAGLFTGADSFCFAAAEQTPFSPPFGLWIAHRGRYPLYNLRMDIERRAPTVGGSSHYSLPVYKGLDLGDLSVSGDYRAPKVELDFEGSEAVFDITFTARNGAWSEVLWFHRVNNKWVQWLRVTEPSGQRFEKVGEYFPACKCFRSS
jgi:hypothetical protein